MKEYIAHNWETCGAWGVVIGVSRCTRCGKVATQKDFVRRT